MKESEGTKLLEGFLNGAKEVVNQKQELNRINVFPVADGDTGSNLAALMQTILDQVSIQTNSIKDGLNQLSEAAMMGARGNSGMIFAQYFYGLSTSYDDALVAEKALVYAAQEASKKHIKLSWNQKKVRFYQLCMCGQNISLSRSNTEIP